MATFTWNPRPFAPSLWNDPSKWDPAGGITYPGTAVAPARDVAFVSSGTATYALPVLDNVQLTLGAPLLAFPATVATTNVEFGKNFLLTTPLVQGGLGDALLRVNGQSILDAPTVVAGISYPGAVISTQGLGLLIQLGADPSQPATTPLLINHGSITVGGPIGGGLAIDLASGTSAGTFENDTTILAFNSFQVRAGVTLSGAGEVNMSGLGARADILGAVGAGQTLRFVNQSTTATSGSIHIANLNQFQGTLVMTGANILTIDGFSSGKASYDGSTLTFANGQHLSLQRGGDAQDFIVQTTGSNSTLVIGSVFCFQEGTKIAAGKGDVPVESLRPGDQVRLARGGTAPVIWTGHRRVDCGRHPSPASVWPVLVRAGAFGDNIPRHDVRLSRDHAVYMDGVLIPIRYLINDVTIIQEEADAVTYWHVELAAHDVILAEGLPCESFLDTGNRDSFANGGVVLRMHPDFIAHVREAYSCAPLVITGPALEAARRHLLRRAETQDLGIARKIQSA